MGRVRGGRFHIKSTFAPGGELRRGSGEGTTEVEAEAQTEGKVRRGIVSLLLLLDSSGA